MKSVFNSCRSAKILLLAMSLGVASQAVQAQRIPEFLGEFVIHVHHSDAFHIDVTAQGSIHGSRCDWYPATPSYSHYESDDVDLYLPQIDRDSCGGGKTAFCVYRISINTDYVDVDFRDADYGDGTSGAGTGYGSADAVIHYDYSSRTFYTFDKNGDSIRISSSTTVWETLGKSPEIPRVPVTIQTQFGGGTVTVDGGPVSSPCKTQKWYPDSSHSLNVTSPQSGSHVTFYFSSWSDNVNQSRSASVSVNDFGKVFTANFTAKPDAPTGLTFTGDIGDPVQLAWTDNPNQNVTRYDIWRAVNKPDEYTKISSVDSGVGSWVDPEYVYSAQTDSLLRYRVYAWYDSSGVSGLSDPAYSGVANGRIGLRKGAPAVRTAESPLLPKTNAIACYPDPFNPSTTFKVSLVSDAEVRMEIYDIMGRRVKMLADGQRSAGYHA